MSTIRLSVNRLGHVPSFKNNKMLARGRLITDPKKQEWMEQCIRSIESQLRSVYQTIDTGTLTGLSLPCWIASSLPHDDSVQWISSLRVEVVTVEAGQEGAEIVVERVC